MLGSDIRSDPGPPTDIVPGETSLLALYNSFLRRRRLIVSLSLGGLLAGVAFGLTRPHTYTSHASFTADDQRGNNASALAGQLGLGALLGGGGQSAQLFLDMLQSPVILGPVADSVYTVASDSGPLRTTLVQLYAGRGRTPLEKRENAVRQLVTEVKGEIRPSGAISVDVKTPDARLSQAIAARILVRLDQFNLERRQQRASSERLFNEERVAEVQAELRTAEARLEAFMQDNRAYRNSPALTFEADRLQRNVTFRQTLFTAVAQAYEQARFEEARNTPTVSLAEPASYPAHEDPRWGRAKSGLLGMVIGFVVGLMITVFRDLFARTALANEEDAAEFALLRDRAVR